MTEGVLIGLRIGAIILWAWIGLRVVFDSWTVTRESEDIRKRGWQFFRAGLLVMSVIVVFIFSPADILIANGLIDQPQRQALSALGVVGLHVSAILLHLGLDIANHHTRKTLPIYLAISALCLAFALWRHPA